MYLATIADSNQTLDMPVIIMEKWKKTIKLEFNPFVLHNLEPNVPQEIPLFIRNQYSVIARKKSKTTAIISIVKI